jgi:hypothetical protein
MKFYKVISGNTFIGIGTTDNLFCYLAKNKTLITTTENMAQYIQIGNNFYHATWMRKGTEDIESEIVDVIEITEEEYNDIDSTIDKGEEIIIEPDEPEIPESSTEEEEEEPTVDYVKNNKIAEIRKACNQAITNGLDITLSDNKSHHFSLTEQDQSNLIALSLSVAKGETAIPYHADDELCVFYSANDITTIVDNATAFITLHTTYHNSLKAYVKSLRSVNTIAKVQYGMEIPEKYQSDVLKAIYAQGGVITIC